MKKIKIIVGLGNPDKKYLKTRHNIGFMAIDNIKTHFDFPNFKTKTSFNAAISESTIDDTSVLLVKPLTYMNLSGQAVSSILRFHKLKTEDLIVIYDDIDLNLTKIRIKANGGPGTHNGMKSIVTEVGANFTRIRIGIRGETYEDKPMDLAGYVLCNFEADEQVEIANALTKTALIVADLINQPPENVMNKYNS